MQCIHRRYIKSLHYSEIIQIAQTNKIAVFERLSLIALKLFHKILSKEKGSLLLNPPKKIEKPKTTRNG